jgi:hypothetical protein
MCTMYMLLGEYVDLFLQYFLTNTGVCRHAHCSHLQTSIHVLVKRSLCAYMHTHTFTHLHTVASERKRLEGDMDKVLKSLKDMGDSDGKFADVLDAQGFPRTDISIETVWMCMYVCHRLCMSVT